MAAMLARILKMRVDQFSFLIETLLYAKNRVKIGQIVGGVEARTHTHTHTHTHDERERGSRVTTDELDGLHDEVKFFFRNKVGEIQPHESAYQVVTATVCLFVCFLVHNCTAYFLCPSLEGK